MAKCQHARHTQSRYMLCIPCAVHACIHIWSVLPSHTRPERGHVSVHQARLIAVHWMAFYKRPLRNVSLGAECQISMLQGRILRLTCLMDQMGCSTSASSRSTGRQKCCLHLFPFMCQTHFNGRHVQLRPCDTGSHLAQYSGKGPTSAL